MVQQFDEWLGENALNEADEQKRATAKAWSNSMRDLILETFEDSIFKATDRQVNNGTFEVRLRSSTLQQSLYDNVIKPRLKKSFPLETFLERVSRPWMVYYSSQKIQSGQTALRVTTQETAVAELKKRFIQSSLIVAITYCEPDKILYHKKLMKGYPLSSSQINAISLFIPNAKHLLEINPEVRNIASPFFVYYVLLQLDRKFSEQLSDETKKSIENNFWFNSGGGKFRAGDSWRETFDVSFVQKWKIPPANEGEPTLVLNANVKLGENDRFSKHENLPFATSCSAEQFASKLEEPFKSAFIEACDPASVEKALQLIHNSRGQLTSKKFGF
jgi:hypothetical protein